MTSKSLFSGVAVALLATASQFAVAQTAAPQATTPAPAAPITRAERKKQTAAENKAGELIPAGQAGYTPAAPKDKSTLTRAERKKETAAANKAGKINSGEASDR